MEELVLTEPVVVPEKVTNKYNVSSLLMSSALTVAPIPPAPPDPGLVEVEVKDNHGVTSKFRYTGKTAMDMIKFFNTANFTTKSMHKRILERLSADGLLVGTVQGAPDPAAGKVFGADAAEEE